MEFNWIEWVGYAASLIVAISLLMSSIVKLRWLSLVGSLTFSIYGFLIGAMPVCIMNLFIVFINIYYLIKMKAEKEYFKLIKISNKSEYLSYFFDFYKDEIKRLSPDFKIEKILNNNSAAFYILRNTVPAGIFTGYRFNETTFMITLDFVTPEFRDFKVGKFIYENNIDYFINEGYKRLCVQVPKDKSHIKYLEKMGFSQSEVNGQFYYTKNISKQNKSQKIAN